MVKILEAQGFRFVSWPESVPIAGAPNDTTTKGVGGVPAPHRAKLLKALANARDPLDVNPIPKQQRQGQPLFIDTSYVANLHARQETGQEDESGDINI